MTKPEEERPIWSNERAILKSISKKQAWECVTASFYG
jgi:hypothetical protein